MYPDVEIDEIKKNAKKTNLGLFMKQYKKGDFLYTIEKKPFCKPVYVAVHIPSGTISYYTLFLGWQELGTWSDFEKVVS